MEKLGLPIPAGDFFPSQWLLVVKVWQGNLLQWPMHGPVELPNGESNSACDQFAFFRRT
jgi:hypothetical protein